ncbi:hypothetical protein B7P43_G10546 [Cryptotermes secundus]|uniref:Uncharacterized protein n=1 Tax=Cryptotermes secundus TaxID=105785 RepID=A0A2J7PRY5_9NEOP|nr:hypothetical protein B7P43_G10546 [Cryptotermes secundus]
MRTTYLHPQSNGLVAHNIILVQEHLRKIISTHKVLLSSPTSTKGKSPKLYSSWEGQCNLVTLDKNVINWIQRNPRSRFIAVHLYRRG